MKSVDQTGERSFLSIKQDQFCLWICQETLSLHERTYTYTSCGIVLDLDVNAAVNVLNASLSTTNSSSGSHACGVGDSGLHDGASETTHIEAGTKGDAWDVSQISMF
jgi:putative transposase